MIESTTVTVGLDVHARSIRLAAVRADELLEERTLPYDEEAVERLLRRWPAVRCCYEAGPTGFGLYRHLVERGIDCAVVAPGLGAAAAGRSRSRPIRVTRASSRGCSPAGCSSRSTSPRRSWRRPAIWCAPARTRGWIGCATGIGSRSSACATGGCCRPAPGRSLGASGSASSASSTPPSRSPSIPTCTRSTSSTPGSSSSSARSARRPSRSPWRDLVARLRCLRGIDTLTALALVAEIGDFSRFRSAEEFMAFVGLVPSEHSSGERRRQGSITKVGNSHVRRLLVESAWHARRRPKVGYELSRRQRGQDALVDRARLALPAAPLPALATDGRTRQTAPEDRRRLRPRARRLRLGDRDRPTTQESLIQPLGLEQRMRPTTRRTLASSMRHPQPVTRDLRQRQLPTVPSHAVPTRECQSDPPSLLRTVRCSRPRGQPIDRASPLDLLLHVSFSRAPVAFGPPGAA